MAHQVNIKYRNWLHNQPPRPIKLEIPGWSGEKHWETGQPWHCKPFVDGATYGLEIIYPFKTEVRVTNENGKSEFHCESKKEWEDRDVEFPFKNFAPNHFGFTSSTDIQTEPGYGVLILPHPRFYTDLTGEVPVPSIGLLESDWWPKIFFIAYRAPLKGTEYVFRTGEGIAQVLIVPKEVEYNVQQMTFTEQRERNIQEATIAKYGKQIATKSWEDKNGLSFDNKYKVLSQMNCRNQSVTGFLEKAVQFAQENEAAAQAKRRDRLSRVYIKPEKRNANRMPGERRKIYKIRQRDS